MPLRLRRQADRENTRGAFVATPIFAGLRTSEASTLRRHHVNLPAGRIEVPGTKSDAAAREVDLLPVLHDELGAYLATEEMSGLTSRCSPPPEAPTATATTLGCG